MNEPTNGVAIGGKGEVKRMRKPKQKRHAIDMKMKMRQKDNGTNTPTAPHRRWKKGILPKNNATDIVF